MARYADEGHTVRVLTCTGGERGDILNPAMDIPGVRDNIVDVRREEMAEAARILGVEHRWLGYEDSGLPEGDPLPDLPEGCFALQDIDAVTRQVVEEIREFRPHVLITYDENGGYPHPDHIMVHQVSVRAWDAAADADYHPELGRPWEIAKLYYTHGFVRGRFEAVAEALTNAPADGPHHAEEVERAMSLLEFFHRMPDISYRVTTKVPVGPWLDRRNAALLAHATQIDPQGPFLAVDVELERTAWPTEEFELAETRVVTRLPESDLFTGIPVAELD